jgi:hypothetical protein
VHRPCPSLGLISDAGLVVKTGVVSDDDVGFQSGTSVRFLQVTGSDFPGATGPETTYDVSLRDTTYTFPPRSWRTRTSSTRRARCWPRTRSR